MSARAPLPWVEVARARDIDDNAADVVDVVWVHGFGGSPQHVARCAQALAERARVRVRAVLLPGHGGGAASSFDDAVAALADVVDDRVVLWGYSLGARLAIAAAARRAPRALICESARGDVDDDARARADDALAVDLAARGVDAFFADWERGPLFAHLTDEQRHLRAAGRAGLIAVDVASALRAFSPGRQPQTPLERVSCPALIVAGAIDARYVSFAHSLHHKWPQSELHLTPGAGHAVHAEASDALAALIARFVRALPPSAASSSSLVPLSRRSCELAAEHLAKQIRSPS